MSEQSGNDPRNKSSQQVTSNSGAYVLPNKVVMQLLDELIRRALQLGNNYVQPEPDYGRLMDRVVARKPNYYDGKADPGLEIWKKCSM